MYFCVYEWNKITQLAINRFAEALVSCFVPNAKRYIRMPPLQFWLLQITISDVMMLAFTALLVWTLFNFASILCPRVSLVPLDKWTFCLITVIRYKRTASVIPLVGATAPLPGDSFKIGESFEFIVKSVKKSRARKDVEKWDLEGTYYPEVPMEEIE